MNTKRTLLAGLAGLLVTGLTAFAGPDSWKSPQPSKPKSPCRGACPPAGACCDVKSNFTASPSGHGMTRNVTVLCKDTCAMPPAQRSCCTKHCAH